MKIKYIIYNMFKIRALFIIMLFARLYVRIAFYCHKGKVTFFFQFLTSRTAPVV